MSDQASDLKQESSASFVNSADLKQEAVAAAATSSFSVTDILSPLEVVAANTANTNTDYTSRPRSDLVHPAYMCPSSPSAENNSSNVAQGKKN